jgi:hypothetical protein
MLIILNPNYLLTWAYDAGDVKQVSEHEYAVYSEDGETTFRAFRIPKLERELGETSLAFFCKRDEDFFIDFYFEKDDEEYVVKASFFEHSGDIDIRLYIRDVLVDEYQPISLNRFLFIKTLIKNFLSSMDEYRLLILTGEIVV